MNRRHFLGSAALLTGTAAAADLPDVHAPEPDVKIGLYSISYLGVWYRGDALSIEQVIDRAHQCGNHGVEIDGNFSQDVTSSGPYARFITTAPGAARCHARTAARFRHARHGAT